MNLTAWRIINKRHAISAFSGEGAKLYGGRWNPPGWAAVYAADSLALAILELIVHLDEDRDLQDYVAIPIDFEETGVISWPETLLPETWSCLPISDKTQQMGKTWLEEQNSPVLKVPSSVVHRNYNFIINPLHPDFSSFIIGPPQPLQIDPRLAARLQ